MNFSSRDLSYIVKNPQAQMAFLAGDIGRLNNLVQNHRDMQDKDEVLRLIDASRGKHVAQMPIWFRQSPLSEQGKAWIRRHVHQQHPNYRRIMDYVR